MPYATRTLGLLAAALLVAAAPAAAQQADDGPWHPTWGDWSLSFELPAGGGGGFGFWRQRGWNTALGLTLGGELSVLGEDGADDVVDVAVAVGPAFKRYWWQDRPVAPFFRADLRGLYERGSEAGVTEWRMGGGLDLGLGAEWFPARGVGIAGHTGLRASYLWLTDDDDLTADRTRILVDLFTSALTLQIYF